MGSSLTHCVPQGRSHPLSVTQFPHVGLIILSRLSALRSLEERHYWHEGCYHSCITERCAFPAEGELNLLKQADKQTNTACLFL